MTQTPVEVTPEEADARLAELVAAAAAASAAVLARGTAGRYRAFVEAQQRAARELRSLWGLVVSGDLAFGEFVPLAAETVVAEQAFAWTFADVDYAADLSEYASFDVDPIGYDMPDWMTDTAAVERALYREMTDTPEWVSRIPNTEERYAADDERRYSLVENFLVQRSQSSYQHSASASLTAYAETGMVYGYRRLLAANACSWCVMIAGGGDIRPWHHRFSVHKPTDHCRQEFVWVPADDIGATWRRAERRRLEAANTYVLSRESRVDYVWQDAA